MAQGEATPKTTPMIRQYLEIKAAYPGYILFYRMGDFYEMFYSDAETASRDLEITLTARNKNEAEPVPMCGVPVKAAESYIGRLIEKGHKVAICEQTEDPAAARGLVKREVVRVVTPGMVVNNELLDAKSNNFILAVAKNSRQFGLSCLDLSTGTFRVAQSADISLVVDEARRIAPSEVLLPESAAHDPDYARLREGFPETAITYAADDIFDHDAARQRLLQHFKTRSLEGFGCEGLYSGVSAAGALLHHVRETQKQQLVHIAAVETYGLENYLLIDDVSCRNLELLANLQNGTRQGTLLGVLDLTVTAMGGRMLKRWIRYPLLCEQDIRARQDAVAAALVHSSARKTIRETLKSVADLERLGGKAAMGQANARDLVALKRSIQALPEIFTAMAAFDTPLFRVDASEFAGLYELAEEIDSAIVDDPPPTIHEGNMIRRGYDAELDELIAIAHDGKSFLAELEAGEREKTGINTLKVRYNRVFGYYIEVSKANTAAVPEHYVRKQTLVNAERYITDELKSFETRVLGAQEQQAGMEYDLFCKLRSAVVEQNASIQAAAGVAATVDGLLSLAEVAEKQDYTRPTINTGGVIDIRDGRHPVVEKLIAGERFVPNTVRLDNTESQILIITGPNMAGKSTVLRQVALMVLMAQIGGFVPAKSADICVTDRIFTRVGALDNLSRGQSTFMVEMEETANIVNNAGPDSLVIMDEIGRGTSTYDGLSIAWAVAEFLHDIGGVGVKSLFATHYHELTELQGIKDRVKNYSIAVREKSGEIIFLHQLVEGATNRSYGIEVARLAGMPEKVVEKAKNVLAEVEKEGQDIAAHPVKGGRRQKKSDCQQLPLFRSPEQVVYDKLMAMDVSNMTPIEAINCLNTLKETVLAGDSTRNKQAGHG
ncbi:MAG: DNA mismatch repair protein MutS [Thermodesulfobacteriota bacterium]